MQQKDLTNKNTQFNKMKLLRIKQTDKVLGVSLQQTANFDNPTHNKLSLDLPKLLPLQEKEWNNSFL